MQGKDFTMKLSLAQSPAEVYAAVNNVRGWWQGEIEGSAEKVGDEFTYRMRDLHHSSQRVAELVPNQRIVWQVTDSDLSFTERRNEWTGTTIRFDIAAASAGSELTFSHEGLTPAAECFDACSNGWTMLLRESLKSLLATGKGALVF